MGILTPHQANALDYSKHISLTANAGSGKTFVLSKRYLQIALNENIPLRNIAAITFTEKAAGELYKKISGEIEKLISETSDQGLLKKLERLRRQLVSANISTIHSFCIDILREFPVEARLDANFTPIDQTLSDELIELSVEETIKENLNSPAASEPLKDLIRLFSSKLKLSTEAAALIRNRKNVLETEDKYTGDVKKTAHFFYESFLSHTEKIFADRIDDLIKALTAVNSEVLNGKGKAETAAEVQPLLGKLKLTSVFEEKLKLLHEIGSHIITQAGSIKITGYLKRDVRDLYRWEIERIEQFFSEIKNFQIPDNHAQIELQLAETGKKIFTFFKLCLNKYEEHKKEEGYLDYEDLLLKTKNILQNKQVQAALSEKYKYIMVDEYQDTNEIQYKIFLPILDHLKRNNLFVVGDEKQSIYRFRDAELEVFSRTKTDIAGTSGEQSLLTLPDTFRMAPSLCLFTNKLFRELFSNPVPEFNEVEHSEMICARDTKETGKVEILIKKEGTDEADLAALRILKLLNEHGDKYNWGSIAVLCRKRKSFNELEHAFVKYGIPYTIIGGRGFYQRQPVYEVYNYFAFLLDTADDASLAGILRSPLFGLSDADLFRISLEKGNSFWEKFSRSAANEKKYNEIVSILNENLRLCGSYDLTFLLRKIVNETGYLAVLSSGPNRIQENANMRKLIRLTSAFFDHGYKTLYDYVNFLKEAIEAEADEPQAAVADESNAVNIMTVHQAKGLEFPLVILFNSDDTTRKSIARSKEIIIDKSFGILTKVPLNNDYFSSYSTAPVINLSSYINEKKNTAETKRLFYVAVTRAKDILIISGVPEKSQRKDSFAGLLAEGLGLNTDAEEHQISEKIKYLVSSDEVYSIKEENSELIIPIIRKIENVYIPSAGNETENRNLTLDLSVIEDTRKEEIISATKYSVYMECPLKYKLIYEYGFSELYSFSQHNSEKEEYMPSEDENEEGDELSSDTAGIKGRIIHKVLQMEIEPGSLDTAGREIIHSGLLNTTMSQPRKELLTGQIIQEIKTYYASSGYDFLRSFISYKNEYNVYLKENNYFLFGIIDKLINDNNRCFIVDYKTDDIEESSIEERAVKYFNQLKFYSYIIKSALKNLEEIILKLVFLKFPDKNITLLVTPDDILSTRNNIAGMVKQIRSGTSARNTGHCSRCHFFINKNCIVTKEYQR